MKEVGALLWIAGIILANGFWSTALAVIVPFWAWVIVVLRMLEYLGVS